MDIEKAIVGRRAVRDQSLLDRVSREAKAYMQANLPAGPMGAHLQARLDDPDFHIFYHAPTLILISASAPGPSKIARWRRRI